MIVDLRQYPALYGDIPVAEGVVLRPMRTGDATELLAIVASDPPIRQRVGVVASWKSEADVHREVACLRTDDSLIRYVILRDQTCIVLVSFWRDTGYFHPPGNPYAFGFGFFLSPEARGQGIVTRSVTTLMRLALANFIVEEFIAFCEDDNPASQRVLQTLGFEPTDTVYTDPRQDWAERQYRAVVAEESPYRTAEPFYPRRLVRFVVSTGGSALSR